VKVIFSRNDHIVKWLPRTGEFPAKQKILHYKIASYTLLKIMAESMANLEAAEILSHALKSFIKNIYCHTITI